MKIRCKLDEIKRQGNESEVKGFGKIGNADECVGLTGPDQY